MDETTTIEELIRDAGEVATPRAALGRRAMSLRDYAGDLLNHAQRLEAEAAKARAAAASYLEASEACEVAMRRLEVRDLWIGAERFEGDAFRIVRTT